MDRSESVVQSNLFKILNVTLLSSTTYRLRIERPRVTIKAGQCFNVGYGGTGVNREYSMCSAAHEPYLEFLIKEVEEGHVSPLLKRASIGEFVELSGPFGEFCLKEPTSSERKYLFVATGTGIAPFRSFVRSYPYIDYKLLHGVRYPSDSYGKGEYDDQRYIMCISRNEDGTVKKRVTDYLRENPVAPDTLCYLCGNRNMIIDAVDILREQDVPGDNIFTEVFF